MQEPKLYGPTNEILENLLFKQVEKPKNIYSIKIVNVYENRYRINIWVRIEEDGLTKTKIGASYFAIYNGNELVIK